MIARVRPLVTLLLLALWLPVTQHCGLEGAGLLADPMECHAGGECRAEHETDSCDVDNCRSVEDGAYKSTFAVQKIAAPTAVLCACCLHVISPETIPIPLISPERTNPPPELAPSWQFIARAAPSPRAPSAFRG